MCNCGSPNAENYVTMNNAHTGCSAYPHDSAGHGSCIANSLGFVSSTCPDWIPGWLWYNSPTDIL